MHPRPGDRSDVHDRAFRRFQLVEQAARQHDRSEEVHLKNAVPIFAQSVDRAQPFAAAGFEWDGGIVDKRMEFAIETPLGLDNRLLGIFRISQIDLNVILRSCFPWTILRERMARTGNHPPACRREPLYGGMADASARSSKKE